MLKDEIECMKVDKNLSASDLRKMGYYTFLCLSATFVFKITFVLAYNFLYEKEIPLSVTFDSGYELTLWGYSTALVLASIFKTVIFVVLIHTIIKRVSTSQLIFIIVSGMCFGCGELLIQTFQYTVISEIIGGMILAHSYAHFFTRVKQNHASYAVIIIHFLYNLVVLHLGSLGIEQMTMLQ